MVALLDAVVVGSDLSHERSVSSMRDYEMSRVWLELPFPHPYQRVVSRCEGSKLFVISNLKHVVENSYCLPQFSHKYNLVIKTCMLVAYCAIIAMSYRISVDLDDREREKCLTFS
jgi:hypothetical protein